MTHFSDARKIMRTKKNRTEWNKVASAIAHTLYETIKVAEGKPKKDDPIVWGPGDRVRALVSARSLIDYTPFNPATPALLLLSRLFHNGPNPSEARRRLSEIQRKLKTEQIAEQEAALKKQAEALWPEILREREDRRIALWEVVESGSIKEKDLLKAYEEIFFPSIGKGQRLLADIALFQKIILAPHRDLIIALMILWDMLYNAKRFDQLLSIAIYLDSVMQ